YRASAGARRTFSGEKRERAEEVTELLALGAQVFDVVVVRRRLERDPFEHLDPVALEPADLPRVVGEEAHLRCADVAEHLRGDAVVAEILLETEIEVRLHGIATLVLQRIGADLVAEADTPALLAHVDEDASAFAGDLHEGLLQLVAAVAAQ